MYHRAMLDHEEKFLFKEEILHLANAVAEPGILDNVEDLLTDVITSPRFDSEVFTLERSLQVMLGPRAGTTLVGLLTVFAIVGGHLGARLAKRTSTHRLQTAFTTLLVLVAGYTAAQAVPALL